jgi:hypothetical protein
VSISQLKRLELREGAEGLKDERRDLATARELIPRLLVFTPNPGTQQELLLQDDFWVSTGSVEGQALLSSRTTKFPHLPGLLESSAPSACTKEGSSPTDDRELHGQNRCLVTSSVPAKILTGQKPVALEDKQTFLELPLHAQPEKSVTNAESEAGAARNLTAS